MRAAQERPLAEGSGVLVIVTLYGGNDGINTVIPYADNAYHDARPELAYAADEVLHLDDQLGLNPALHRARASCGSSGSWRSCAASAIRSPTTATSVRWTSGRPASPTEPVSTGWIGRWLDATGNDPLRAVNIGAVLPPLAVGEKTTAAALSTSKELKSGGRDSPRRWMRSASTTPATHRRWRRCVRPTGPTRTVDTTFSVRQAGGREAASHWPAN